jgi:Uma2 family endonuclease
MATVSSHISPSLSSRAAQRLLPPLQHGDRLTHAQFMERYEKMAPNVKAERIEGIIHMPAAALSQQFHGRPHAAIMTWLGAYWVATPGTDLGDNSTIILDIDNDPQSDACLSILDSHGGKVKLNADGYIVGAPELVVEITASSLSFDLGDKLNAYRRNGVLEYLVHRVYDGQIDWFVLRDGQYQNLPVNDDGVYRSEIFPGLWLKAEALITGNRPEVMAVLQQGIAGEAHRDFVNRLELQRPAGS